MLIFSLKPLPVESGSLLLALLIGSEDFPHFFFFYTRSSRTIMNVRAWYTSTDEICRVVRELISEGKYMPTSRFDTHTLQVDP